MNFKPVGRGNCYVTCEALYHLLGGAAAGYTPHSVRHEGAVHWYLVLGRRCVWSDALVILDPTASQFKTPPPYHKGRGCGFLTKEPSLRARMLMSQMLWQDPLDQVEQEFQWAKQSNLSGLRPRKKRKRSNLSGKRARP